MNFAILFLVRLIGLPWLIFSLLLLFIVSFDSEIVFIEMQHEYTWIS